MSVTSISGGSGSIWEALRTMKTNGGLTKEGLSSLQSEDSGLSSALSELVDSYDKIDTDSNGKLSDTELQTYAKNAKLQLGGGRGPGGAPPSGEPPELSEDQLKEIASDENNSDSSVFSAVAANFSTADTDGNGKISHSEFTAYAEANNLELSGPSGGTPPPPPPTSSTSDDSSNSTSSETTSKSSTASTGTEALQFFLSAYLNSFSSSTSSSLLSQIQA